MAKYQLAGLLIIASVLCVSCGGGVTMAAPPAPVATPPAAAPSATLTANPSEVLEGQSVMLSWQTANATEVNIAGIGAVSANGSQSVIPTTSTTYTLTATGAGGTFQATTRVTVDPPSPPPPSAPPSVPTHWMATDLPPLPGMVSAQAEAINSNGDIVGYSVDVLQIPHATLWKNGQVIELSANSVALAMNDSDKIVGYRLDTDGLPHAHSWPDDIDILGSELFEGHDSSLATGINNSGAIVGYAYDLQHEDSEAAFVLTETGLQNLTSDSTPSNDDCYEAHAINNSGHIAGFALDSNAAICGEEDFGMLGMATAINNLGQAVGVAENQSWLFPAINIPVNTTGFSSVATGINDNAWVVGCTCNLPVRRSKSGGPRSHLVHQVIKLNPRDMATSQAWIWSEDAGVAQTLPFLSNATGINNAGQVVGAGIINGNVHGMLVTGN